MSKTKQFCETSFKNGKLSAELTASYQCVLRFFQVIRSAAPVAQNHLSKPKNLMLQNATRLRKSAPWPPNISDGHVSCIAPATQNASFQILFKCSTPAIVFGNASKPSHFFSFLAQCTIPCACHAKRSEHVVFLTFWLGNVLRATTACTFSTSQLPKVVRAWCVLHILTSKCASRHNGVHFFDISTSKSGPNVVCFLYSLTSKSASRHNGVHFFDISTSKSGPDLVCFVHFDFEMCFAPQRRASFHFSSGQIALHPPL